MARVERQLAAKEAYITAKKEASKNDRQAMIEEVRSLIGEVLKDKDFKSE